MDYMQQPYNVIPLKFLLMPFIVVESAPSTWCGHRERHRPPRAESRSATAGRKFAPVAHLAAELLTPPATSKSPAHSRCRHRSRPWPVARGRDQSVVSRDVTTIRGENRYG